MGAEHHRNRRRQPQPDHGRRDQKAVAHPAIMPPLRDQRRQQQHRKQRHAKGEQARDQRPEPAVQRAHIPDRPAHRKDADRTIQRDAAPLAAKDQPARDDGHQSRNGKEPTAAMHQQQDARKTKGKAEYDTDNA